MPLSYSQFVWGFELLDAISGAQNNKLDFTHGTAKSATLAAGVYTVDEFATLVASGMNAADPGFSYTCTFSYTTLKFTITTTGGTESFSLTFGSGTSPATLLGFPASNTSSATSHLSPSAAGAGSSTAGAWTAVDPLVMNSPVDAQAAGTAAKATQRSMRVTQQVSDGGTVESIFISALKSVQIAFRALTTTERDNMELFLNWAMKGKRFTWQPDKASASLIKLVLANPNQINNQFEWLTRSETGYGTLSFYEQLSP